MTGYSYWWPRHGAGAPQVRWVHIGYRNEKPLLRAVWLTY
jgi:hypothetical protein